MLQVDWLIARLRPKAVSRGSMDRQLDCTEQSPQPSHTASLMNSRFGGSSINGLPSRIFLKVSLDWRWLFIYPNEGIASLNRLVVPAGVPLRFRLTSTTVMNSFFVPQLGSQIYTMPNMVTRLNLEADQPGTFEGLSAQFSGDGFSDMRFDLVSMAPEAYEEWLSTTKTQGGVLDKSTFAELVKPAKAEGAQTYAQVSEGLFDSISSGHMAAVSPQRGQ